MTLRRRERQSLSRLLYLCSIVPVVDRRRRHHHQPPCAVAISHTHTRFCHSKRDALGARTSLGANEDARPLHTSIRTCLARAVSFSLATRAREHASLGFDSATLTKQDRASGRGKQKANYAGQAFPVVGRGPARTHLFAKRTAFTRWRHRQKHANVFLDTLPSAPSPPISPALRLTNTSWLETRPTQRTEPTCGGGREISGRAEIANLIRYGDKIIRWIAISAESSTLSTLAGGFIRTRVCPLFLLKVFFSFSILHHPSTRHGPPARPRRCRLWQEGLAVFFVARRQPRAGPHRSRWQGVPPVSRRRQGRDPWAGDAEDWSCGQGHLQSHRHQHHPHSLCCTCFARAWCRLLSSHSTEKVSMESSTIYQYAVFATSSFQEHSSGIAALSTATSIMTAVSKPIIGKIADVWARPYTCASALRGGEKLALTSRATRHHRPRLHDHRTFACSTEPHTRADFLTCRVLSSRLLRRHSLPTSWARP